jgi:purine-binding chemotaxis protein CheW
MKAAGGTRTQVVDEKSLLEIVIFQLDKELFGLDIYRIVEITRMLEITKVPRSLSFIEGIINLRGKIIPVVDLRKRIGFASAPPTRLSRVIIIKIEGHRLGLVVDSVDRVVKIPKDTVEPVPPDALQIDADFLSGIGHLDKQLIILLDVDRILKPHEKKLLTEQKGG